MPLDQATADFLSQMAEAGGPAIHEMSPEEARRMAASFAEMIGPGPEVTRSSDHTLLSVDGSSFGATVLVPDGPVRAVVVYYHGGGWVVGSAADYDHLCRTIANRTQCAVVNVDYRLAPEHPYPAAADDCYAALGWAADNVDSIAGSVVPLIVCGDSSGGNLAAVVAQRTRDRNGPKIALQALLCPVTNADFDNESYSEPENQLMLTRDGMIWFWDLYVPEHAQRLEPDASPLQGDLAGLAPAYIMTAEYDILRDEGEAYAANLRAAGVDVRFSRHAGQMHGVLTLPMLPGSGLAMDELVATIEAVLS
jgi:acetyl esterase